MGKQHKKKGNQQARTAKTAKAQAAKTRSAQDKAAQSAATAAAAAAGSAPVTGMAGAASAFRSNAPILPNPNAPRDDEETQPMADRDVTRQRGNATRAEERMAALERENKSLKTQLGQVADTVSGLRSAINRTIANTAVSEEVAASGGEGKRLESVKAFISDGLSLTMVREGKFVAVKFDDEEALRVVKAVFTSPGQKLIGYPVLKERILGVQAILSESTASCAVSSRRPCKGAKSRARRPRTTPCSSTSRWRPCSTWPTFRSLSGLSSAR